MISFFIELGSFPVSEKKRKMEKKIEKKICERNGRKRKKNDLKEDFIDVKK